MISESELKKEKEYLKAVLYLLEKEIGKNETKIDEYAKDIQEQLKYTWDNDCQADSLYWSENVMQIERKSLTAINSTYRNRAYAKMLKSAYFARIDFETEGEVIPVYLGIASLNDGTDFYVYDWRSPICSLFYDFEKGDAEYTAPSGEVIKGKITLKRQYKIEGDKIVQIFDTDMQVVDSILKEMLGGKVTNKMRNIVNTIQKEQNKIIRRNNVDILVVEGPAGSGKTSVAMHKIAYLLYAEKNNINNSNILIISPNDIFSNYISGVLPEIGEDNVYQTTFMDFVRAHVDFKIKGSVNELYETVYSDDPENRQNTCELNSINLKYGATYINLIENFLAENRNKLLGVDDIVVDGKTIIEKEYLEKLVSELEYNGVSLVAQGKKLVEKIVLHSSIKIGKNNATIQKIKKTFENNLSKIRAKDVYASMFSDRDRFVKMVEKIYNETGTNPKNRLTMKELIEIFNYTQALISKNTLPFEDVVGYLYLKDRIHGSTVQSKIKYVIIDEAQDYTIMQYKVLAHLFKRANITILGDINQSIMPYATHHNYEQILNLLKQDRPGVRYDMSYLTKTYRSTYEINMFCKKILGDENMYHQVDRHGDEVEVIKDSDNLKNTRVIADAIELKKQYGTVAIITKTQADAEKLKEIVDLKVKNKNAFKLITGKDKVFVADKILIIPSYISKGLEFDAVLVYNANQTTYPKEFKNLFYVVCTRALHKLNVYYSGKPTTLLKNAKLTNAK